MKHFFVPYELAVIAKEKGFNEKCWTYYGFNTKLKDFNSLGWYINATMLGKQACAPLYQQLVDFLETKGIFVFAMAVFDTTVNPNRMRFVPCIGNIDQNYDDPFSADDITDNKYECLNKAFEEAFKLI